MPLLRRNGPAVPALCVVLWLLCAPGAQAAAALLGDSSQTVELTPQVQFAPGSLSAAKVLSGGAAFALKNPATGHGISAVWIRVPIAAQQGAAGPWVLSLPRSVITGEVYVPDEIGYRSVLIGSSIPYVKHAESYVIVGITIDRTAAKSGKPVYLHLTYHADSPLWVRADTLRHRMYASFS
jgi:hypothetical protein